MAATRRWPSWTPPRTPGPRPPISQPPPRRPSGSGWATEWLLPSPEVLKFLKPGQSGALGRSASKAGLPCPSRSG
eukprot:472529-Alexandrium_andersonii.AAC.1